MTRFIAFAIVSILAIGCSRQSAEQSVSESMTPIAFNAAGAPTVEFSVPDMMCPEGCAVKTKEILSEQPGAKEVIVDFEAKTAIVAIEEGKFDSKDAIAALVDHGFKNSALKNATIVEGSAKPEAAGAVQ